MSPIDRELERALARRADGVPPPAPDLYAGVERRANRLRRQRAGTVAGAALTVLAVAVAVPMLGRAPERDPFTPPGPTTSVSPGPAPTSAPPLPTRTPSQAPSTAATSYRVPVYFAADNGGSRGIRLYREFHSLPDRSVTSAVRVMLRGSALDADYRTLWPDTTKLLGVRVEGDLATVDLDEAARRNNVGSQAAEQAIQQLVYTVTAADNSVKRVRLLIGGQPVSDLWGSVDASRPFTRAPELDVLGTIWLLQPEQYANVGRRFDIGGVAIAFEATVSWRVQVVSTGQEVAKGFATAADGTKRSPWQASVTIPASVPNGTQLEVSAFEESAEDGSEMSTDSKVVVLRG